jgi:group I intron endonuclease
MKPYYEEVRKYELKMPPIIYKDSGVYALGCDVTSKTYIGCTKNFLRRLRVHVSRLRKNVHSNGKLQNAWNKYGERSFTFSIIEYTDNMYTREKKWVGTFNSNLRGMNLTDGGDGCALGTKKAEILRRAKITEAIRTPEVRKKIGDWSKRQWSENYEAMCQARSDAAKKQWADPEMKRKTSELRKARWAARSPEQRAAIIAKSVATRKANRT